MSLSSEPQAYQARCMAGLEPHQMSSHHQPGIVGWIERCMTCGTFDLSAHDKIVKAETMRFYARQLNAVADHMDPPPPTPIEEVEKHSASEWISILGLGQVVDPDGWRLLDGVRWTTPITQEDFLERYSKSTINTLT